jgi:MFS family permease
MGLLLVYGLNTWMPEIMRRAGYELGAALALLLVLNGGGVLGMLLAGLFVFSAQVLVFAYIGQHYPSWARASALGTASGFGRLGAIAGPLLGGVLLTAGLAYPWGFYLFAGVAALGAIAIALVASSGVPG